MIEAIAVVSALLAFIAVREQLTGAAVFSPISYSIIYEGRIRKVLSIFGSPAAMSMALALAAPVLLYGLRHSEHRVGRIVLGATLLATLLGVFYSYVRAGWLGAVLGLAVALIASPAMRKTLIRLAPLIIVAVVALSMLTLVNTQAIEGRLTSEEPLTYRLDAWKLAWQIFRQSPLLGVGYGNYGYVAVRQFGWNPFSTDVEVYPSPHNSYLDIVTQGGLIAFLPYLAVFAFSFLRRLQLRRHALARRAHRTASWPAMILPSASSPASSSRRWQPIRDDRHLRCAQLAVCEHALLPHHRHVDGTVGTDGVPCTICRSPDLVHARDGDVAMRIALLGPYPVSSEMAGGVDAVVAALAHGLARRAGIDLHVIVALPGRPDAVISRDGFTLHIVTHPYRDRLLWRQPVVRRLRHVLANIRPDVAHAHMANIYADAMLQWGGASVATLHGVGFREAALALAHSRLPARLPLAVRHPLRTLGDTPSLVI